MALVTTSATILKSYEYSETSKILRLLTPTLGLCSVIAKGARRPKSRFGGVLEPFTDGVATFHTKEGRELHTLSSFELHRERQALGAELIRFAGAGLLTEIALRFASSAVDEELFLRLRRGLDRLLEADGHVETAILEETWGLIACLGFAPELEHCAGCGERVAHREPAHFDLAGGVINCDRCVARSPGAQRRRLSSAVRADLAKLLQARAGCSGEVATRRDQRILLRDFIAYHLADHRPLNSFRFLDDQLG